MLGNLPEAAHFEAVKRFWRITAEPRFMRAVENFLYAVDLDGTEWVLRLTCSNRRSIDELASELDWIQFLSANGLSVAYPLPSLRGNLVERLSGGCGDYYAAVFRKAPGHSLRQLTDFSDTVVGAWGAYIGRIHALTQRYSVPNGTKRRADWRGELTLQVALRSVDARGGPCSDIFLQLLEWQRGLEQPADGYGLVHADLHHGNFFVQGSTITAFDFDDCCYHWFAYDLAVPWFYLRGEYRSSGVQFAEERLFEVFLEGYAKSHTLSSAWTKRIETFIAYRTALLYHWLKTRLADGDFDQTGIDWCERMMPYYASQLGKSILFE
jgi:amicoumacin kinase